MKHISVLLNESIEGLNIKPDGIYIDATLGYSGHSREIHKRLKRGLLFAFDQDKEAIDYSRVVFASCKNVKIIHANFSELAQKLAEEGISKVDGILFDLGLSSPQIDETERGFSYMKDANLDMRMNRESKLTARDVVNEYSESELALIFFKYGEERYSRQIAKKIVNSRPINTTSELVSVIKSSVPIKYANTHKPEKRIFQAIRIEVNGELKVLESVLPDCIELLNKGGRIAVITFHSLEDRIVKHTFHKYSEVAEIVKGLPEIPEEYKPKIKLINKKPILPTEEEIKSNPRSISAKLRIVERI